MVKTITITDEAYERLRKHKMGGESFTEVIKREFSKKGNISEFVGVWGDLSAKEFSEIKKTVKDTRKKLSADLLERSKRLFK